jgi:hypothetical protein
MNSVATVRIEKTDETFGYSNTPVLIDSTLDNLELSSGEVPFYEAILRIPRLYQITSQKVYEIMQKQNLHNCLYNFFKLLKDEFPNESFRLEDYSDPEEDYSDPRLAITILTKSDDIEGDINKHLKLFEKLTQLQRNTSPDSNDMFLFLEYLE